MKKLGKIDRDLLERFVFRRLGYRRRDVIVPPSFGEDAGVVRAGGGLLVLAMDPITGASELAGWLSVHVNANDVAVMGAEPKWFSATILLPEDRLRDLDRITRDIHRACRSLRVAVVTGHTETSPGIPRPIIVGQMVGELVSRRPITSSGARRGDLLVMSKTAGIEGTAILASDFRGMFAGRASDEVLARAEKFYRRISVVKEALRLARGGLASAMHDATEGGLIGGAYELAEASGCSFIIYEEAVPVAKETRIICEALGCDPLKLISSGVLLAAVPRRLAGRLSRMHGFRVIGELRGRREGNIVVRRDGLEEMVRGPVLDELWRLFMERG
jgi:hydrogenase maturation factor